MTSPLQPTRRELLTAAGALTAAAGTASAGGELSQAVVGALAAGPPSNRVYRIGVISAAIDGRPQRTNGHTWHFAQYFHPEINLAAIRRYLDPGSARMFERYLRSPRYTFDQLPFPDTRITHVYADPADGLTNYIEAFPGVRIARTLDELVESVDAVWLGDASGRGNDHFDLIAPALRRGLPTFCDKPIGGTVAETRRILELARAHRAPLMSSSLFRHEFGSSDSSHGLIVSAGAPALISVTSGSGQSVTVGAGYSAFSVQVTDAFGNPVSVPVTFSAPAAGASGAFTGFSTTASMSTARDEATATLLGNSDVLVAGGIDNSGNFLASAELYNPVTNTWTSAGAMSTARFYATATLLGNGDVLVAGGDGVGTFGLASAELYNPVTNSWSSVPDMAAGREDATATLLGNGDVLVVAGYNATNGYVYQADAQLYNPVTNSWSSAGALTAGRESATATLLGNGDVLVAGGANGNGSLSDAELYNPVTNSWSSTPNMLTASRFATATLLGNGNVLVAGGQLLPVGGATAAAEIYNPVTNSWASAPSMATARADGGAALLGNGDVLVAGGFGTSGTVASAELYNPAVNTWSSIGDLATPRQDAAATLLGNGNVLFVGGYNRASGPLSSAELLNVGTGSVTAASDPLTGIATAAGFTANEIAGSFTITASVHISPTLSFSTSFQATNLAGAPVSVTPRSATTESATVATAYTPPRVLVVDAFGNPVSNSSVTFTVAPAGNGSGATFAGNAASVSVATGANGQAVAPTLTAGHLAGAFMVTASIAGIASPIDFFLTNTAGAATSITVAAGGVQGTPITFTFGSRLEALVADAYGNPVANAAVTFSAPTSGASGTFSALATVATNALGIATAPSVKANVLQGRYAVTATTPGVAIPAGFNLFNTDIPARIGSLTGNNETATVTQAYAVPLQARVTDAQGIPVSGINVVFVLGYDSGASATFTGPAIAITNSMGVATLGTLTANILAGGLSVFASVIGVTTPATFALTNTPGTPTTIASAAGTPASATVAKAYASPPQALVTDAYGNPVSGVNVTFMTPASGASGVFGTLHTSTVATASNGIATAAALTANTVAGSFAVTASISGVTTPATYNLTNLPGPAAKVTANAGSAQTATVAQAFANPLKVLVTDSFNNPASGVSVTFTTPTFTAGSPASVPSGVFTGSNIVLTNASGIATAPTLTANNKAGSFTVSAAVTGLPNVSFALSNATGAPASIAAAAGTPASATVAKAYTQTLQALVKDAYGNPVSGVSVTFTAPTTGVSGAFSGSLTSTAVTGTTGIATAAPLTANTLAGGFAVSASTSGVASPATYNLTNLPGPAAKATVTAGSAQTATVAQAFANPLQVLVTDVFNNPLSGVAVTFAAPTFTAGSPASVPSGVFTGSSVALTNASGIATAPTLTANNKAGNFAVSATVTGAPTVSFALSNAAGAPASMAASAGTPATATVNTAFAQALQAVVKDAFGNPVAGVSVTFTAPANGASGTFAGSPTQLRLTITVVTGANGIATAPALTANTVPGGFTVSASANGVSSASFALSNAAGPPADITAQAGTGQKVVIPGPFNTALQALVTDQFGNPLGGVTVTFTVQPNTTNGAAATFAANGQLNTVTAITSTQGIATAPKLFTNTKRGTYTVSATFNNGGRIAVFSLTNQ